MDPLVDYCYLALPSTFYPLDWRNGETIQIFPYYASPESRANITRGLERLVAYEGVSKDTTRWVPTHLRCRSRGFKDDTRRVKPIGRRGLHFNHPLCNLPRST